MPDDKTAGITPAATTTGRTDAEPAPGHAAQPGSAQPATTPNPGPHNPDPHGTPGATQDTEAQKLEDEAASGHENRY